MEFHFTCSRCNKKVPTNEVRIGPDKKYLCFSCAGYSAPKKESAGEDAPETSSPDKKRKIKYQCPKCKYEFYLKEGHAKKCPYCNSENIQEKQFEAQKLIDMPGNYRDEE